MLLSGSECSAEADVAIVNAYSIDIGTAVEANDWHKNCLLEDAALRRRFGNSALNPNSKSIPPLARFCNGGMRRDDVVVDQIRSFRSW